MMAAQHHAPGADEAALAEQNRRRRKDVIHRYALLHNGKPAFCGLTNGKIIYPTMEAAVAAGAELALIGRSPQTAYECRQPGHYHLYTDTPRARRMRGG